MLNEVNAWTVLSSGVFAAAAALAAIVYMSGSQNAEQVGMLAAARKKV